MPVVTVSNSVPPERRAVLIVDDDAAVRGALKFALELEGFDVRIYDRGEALLADHDLPATGCLVVDYRMPGMNGLELIDHLRDRSVELPAILIVSDHPSQKLRRLAQRSGVQDVLEKPLSDSALIESIRHALVIPAHP